MLCTTVIPTIGRDTLGRAVESALAQGYLADEHEILVINDGGKPLPPDACPWIGGPDADRVRVVDANRVGVTGVCNTGAFLARGTYVNFLHDDDYLLPGGLAALVRAAQAGSRWVIGAAEVVDEKAAPVTRSEAPRPGNLLAELLVGECPHMSYCVIERQAFLDAGAFDPLIRIYEDRDLCWRLALRHDAGSAPEAVACVRASGSPGSAFDFSTIGAYGRIIRERILSAPGALARVRDSLRRTPSLRGRVFRHCLISTTLNLRAGNGWTALSRLTWGLRAVGLLAFLTPGFWRGLRRS